MNQKSLKDRMIDVFLAFWVGVVAFLCVIPMWHVIMASFSDTVLLSRHSGLVWLPLGSPQLGGYQMIFQYPLFFKSYLNTIFYVTVGTVLNMALTIMGGYALSVKNVFFNRAISMIIVFTMYFGGGLIPFFLTVKNLGMLDSWLSLILPSALSAYNLIVMRTAFAATPDSLRESAMIDGAGHFTILYKIYAPVNKATLAVLVLFYAVGHWNSWFNASIFLRKRELYPLQLVMREILIQNDITMMTSSSSVGAAKEYQRLIKYAAIVVSTLPIMCIYPFIQKYFVKGVMIGSIKG